MIHISCCLELILRRLKIFYILVCMYMYIDVYCVSAVVMPLVCLLFGVMAYEDKFWMPRPDLNYLSWSYGLVIVSAFFSIFGSIAIVVFNK